MSTRQNVNRKIFGQFKSLLFLLVAVMIICYVGERNILASEKFMEGEKQFDNRQFDKAIVSYESALRECGENPHIRAYIQNKIAESHLRSGELEESLAAFEKIARDFPESEFGKEVKYRMGMIYYMRNDNEEAAKKFEEFIREGTQSKMRDLALLRTAQCFFRSGSLLKALNSYRKIEKQCKSEPANDELVKQAERNEESRRINTELQSLGGELNGSMNDTNSSPFLQQPVKDLDKDYKRNNEDITETKIPNFSDEISEQDEPLIMKSMSPEQREHFRKKILPRLRQ